MSDASSLREVAILEGLSDKDLEDMAKRLIPVRYSKGQYLFYRNDKSTGLYFVVGGSIQIIIDNELNKEIVVYTISKGDVVGEMSLFSNEKRSATAVALEESHLFKVHNEKFIELMHNHPSIAVNLARVLIDRLLAANEMIERLGAMDGTERVIHFLKSLAAREGVQNGDVSRLENRPTYRQISQRLGVSEKTIYRTMRALVKKGDIEIHGRQLTLNPSIVNMEPL
ncbi:hypothetical protein MNBD_NITROSPINAE02-19 [hydrothermal vent metagenome]|uniref:Cyclic nucleotide-binding domain-containing protein n=1 Tax=hydrothermal vent metagenome TaxID=652676 RepID=A0A3B1C6E1_9ZZZZ